MLRNSFLNRYEKKDSKYSLNEEYLRNEYEEYLIFKNRPLAPKSIAKLSKHHIINFIDDVLTNKPVTSVLYSSNSSKEIGHYIHSIEVMEKNYSSPTKFNTIATQKKKRETTKISDSRSQYSKIREHIKNYKKAKVTHVNLLTKRNNIFFYKIKKQNKTSIRKSTFESINSFRVKNYNRSLKRCKNQIEWNPFFNLPDVKFDVNNVYSRLYHNKVLINRAKTETGKQKIIRKTNKKKALNNTHIDSNKHHINRSCTNITWSNTNKNSGTLNGNTNANENEQVPILFNLKHVIKSSNGKEFTMKVTDRVFNRCFYKHSGGPMSKLMRNYRNNRIKEEDNNDVDDLISLTKLKDSQGNSYLHDAVLDASYEFVKYYLGKSLSPNEQNSHGNTPLHLAMKVCIPKIINLLLENKADLTIENSKKETPYDLAPIAIKKHLKLDQRLVDKMTYQNGVMIV